MRHLILLFALSLTISTYANTAKRSIDSLQSALSLSKDANERIHIYRNLADLTRESPESREYLTKLVEQAKASRDIEPMMEALIDLSVNYITCDNIDSAKYVLVKAEKSAPKEQRDRWCAYLRMRIFSAAMQGEEAGEAVDEKIAELKNRNIAKENMYQQIEYEYILGSAFYYKDQFEDALPYLLKSLELAEKLPLREGAAYQLLIIHQVSRLYNKTQVTQKAYEIVKRAIRINEQYYATYRQAERPFYSMDNFYVSNYSSLLINILHMPDEEARFYLDRLIEMSDRTGDASHKYNRFLALFNYYVSKKDIDQALICNDSLIRYAHQIAVYNLPNLYDLNSKLYQILGEDKKALAHLRESSRLQDSIRQSETQVKLNNLRVEYDINRLNYENSQLEVRNKRIQIITLMVVLLSALILCLYLYTHLKREKEMKERMRQLKMQAEESEKLKTAFINSICHEIRTPLNGIAGFTGLLFDPSIEEEERSTFKDEILQNTDILVGLVDSMLEVANLDVSDAKLPCAPVDLCKLCHTACERYTTMNESSNINLSVRCSNQRLTIPTNERYLALVLENLLSNAYKFTEQGSIDIECSIKDNQAIISITDTGCGIPLANQQEVFDRFIKLDIYKPGNGLGLYLCKTSIRRLSGEIYIDPGYTNGTRVVVILPIQH